MLTLLEPPGLLPVGLSQVKAHLRLDHGEEDEYLTHLIQVATQLVQVYLGRSLMKQTWCLTWNRPTDLRRGLSQSFLKPLRIPLKFSPILGLKSINRLEDGGGKTKISRYFLNTSSVVPYLECSSLFKAVEVVYEAGYGEYPQDIPAPIQQAIIATVTEFYETREPVSVPANTYVQGLLNPYRVTRVV